jgi:hypothetical protein
MGQVIHLPLVLSVTSPSCCPIRLGFLNCRMTLCRLAQEAPHLFLYLHRGPWVGMLRCHQALLDLSGGIMDAYLRGSGKRTLGIEGLWHDEDLRQGSCDET